MLKNRYAKDIDGISIGQKKIIHNKPQEGVVLTPSLGIGGLNSNQPTITWTIFSQPWEYRFLILVLFIIFLFMVSVQYIYYACFSSAFRSTSNIFHRVVPCHKTRSSVFVALFCGIAVQIICIIHLEITSCMSEQCIMHWGQCVMADNQIK